MQEIALEAPLTISMTATMTSALVSPWCAYYNEETEEWEADGLTIASVSAPTADGGVEISCMSYHLSDFGVSTTEYEEADFAEVDLVRTSAWVHDGRRSTATHRKENYVYLSKAALLESIWYEYPLRSTMHSR